MSPMLMIASLAITAALVFYTIGVFAERRAGHLNGRYLALFWAGLACDTTGTTVMTIMARTAGSEPAPAIHGITGLLAIILMLFHAGWATLVYVRGRRHDDKAIAQEQTFHRFSTIVWLLWLVPYIIGLLVGIPMIHMATVPAVVLSVIIVAILSFFLLRPANNVARA